MQQLQKTYSLPNCTLVLDGMSDPTGGSSASPGVMTILTNVVCRFLGHDRPLSGGSDFFNSLVPAVNRYAQAQLSGLTQAKATEGIVSLERTETGLHQLSVAPEPDSGSAGDKGQTLNLTTVQLFDLVEAVDQFLADRATLPSKQLELQPMSKRDIPSQTPMGQRVAAPAIGALGLAAAAAALFALEVPEIRRPQVDATGTVTETTAGKEDNSGDTESVEPSVDPETVGDLPVNPPLIKDAAEVEAIRSQLYDTIDSAWNQYPYPTFTQDAVYRVSASAEGDIVGYRGVDDLAQDVVDELPLPKLLYTPPTDTVLSEEPIAQFEVTFTPEGVLSVKPWEDPEASAGAMEPGVGEATATEDGADQTTEGESGQEETAEDDSATEETTGGGLDEASLNELATNALNADLYNQLNADWKESPSFEEDLAFRVKVNIDSDIVSYEALAPGAEEFLQELPLDKLKKGGAAGDTSEFKVVFKSSGILEVSPWEEN